MTSKTDRMNSVGTALWNRSLMEFTKTSRGFFHRSGSYRTDSCTVTENPFPVLRHAHCLEPFGNALSVTALAAVAYLRAACDRVPGGLRPFDLRCR